MKQSFILSFAFSVNSLYLDLILKKNFFKNKIEGLEHLLKFKEIQPIIYRLIDWIVGWLTDWLINRRLIDWIVGYSSLILYSAICIESEGLSVNHLYSALSQGRLWQCRLGFEHDTLRLLPLGTQPIRPTCLVDWLIDWSIDRLIEWIVGWLIDWSIE